MIYSTDVDKANACEKVMQAQPLMQTDRTLKQFMTQCLSLQGNICDNWSPQLDFAGYEH